MKLISVILLTITPLLQATGQETTLLQYRVETQATVSKGLHAPFWLISNRSGLASTANNSVYLRAAVERDFTPKKGFDWSYGLDMVGAQGFNAEVIVQQLYADLRYHCWQLTVGSKERFAEGKNPMLSAGGMTYSNNARPIPQVRFGIYNYTTVPWLFNGWVQVKGHFSYGWQTDDCFQKTHTQEAPLGTRYIQNVLFHEKTAFLKIGNRDKGPFSAEIGLEMYTQFGGKVYEKKKNGDKVIYDLPHSYKEYIKAFIPLKGGSDAPEMEQTNVNGNQLGSWHFAANYEKEGWKARLYYEHYFEDHSQLIGFAFNKDRYGDTHFITYHPWKDGLYGLELTVPKNRFIQTIVYEYRTTRDQSGPILHNSSDVLTEQVSGFDFYYNHTYYQSWQHWGMSICSPLLLSPIYNKPSNLTMPNQRIRSHHIGWQGSPTQEWDYRTLCSYTRHWGSTEDPLPHPMNQLSALVEISYKPAKLAGWQFTSAIAADQSKLIGNNSGILFSVKKEGFLLP